ncbi:hypothetical protein GE21DRAFT_2199 [Neurospora crassa]|uniref:Uncharacterized protein n=1 Tax=Neurospora crassa (strain ATCC 24698 / 74-OR23-1A / CBS 708.71 / DSM 1257 / FGSC 987) TaxID=367110 RepID=Q7SDK7_NEUCR|nr:hypothetical protein NCU00537 [Neurospora crassa OR74A]EAA34853.2 hypothetical protein NCU00537 [Neurospora crassa OR74A]KHE85119.1 hypothetical protein GE21DRAFT_2199 [Neurospora crassa]|eukprot:XP_964089.2 hypothetical protein NCU00537 [Neurospora crassa OR74A]
MAFLSSIFKRLSLNMVNPLSAADSAQDQDQDDIDRSVNPYQPTATEVILVRAMLEKALRLPPEIINGILDHAEYWPHTSTVIDYSNWPQGQRVVNAGDGNSENAFLLRTLPLGFLKPPSSFFENDSNREVPLEPIPREPKEFPVDTYQSRISPTLSHPCRKIKFTIVSHDQGWGGEARTRRTYNSSYTWFDIGLERCLQTSDDIGEPTFDPQTLSTILPKVREVDPNNDGDRHVQGTHTFDFPLCPQKDTMIQCNEVANGQYHQYEVEWKWTDNLSSADLFDSGYGCEEGLIENPLPKVGRGQATGDGKFVRDLKLGDVITVWAKARFAGWANYIKRIQVDVYWVV